MFLHKIDRASVAPRAQALAGNVVLIWWDAPVAPQNGTLVATLGSETVARPFATLTLRTAWSGCRTVFVLRWPAARTADSVLAVRDGVGQVLVEFPALPGSAVEEFTPDALLEGLDQPERLRLVRLVVELCPGIFRLGANRAFAQNCRRLVAELVPDPSPLRADIRLTDRLVLGSGTVPQELGQADSVLLIDAGTVRQANFTPSYAPAEAQQNRLPFRLVVEKSAADAGTLAVLFGAGGMLCCRLCVAPGGGTPLLEWLERNPRAASSIRDYAIRSLGAVAETDGQAGGLLRELQLFAPLPRKQILVPTKPIGADIELAVSLPGGGLFVSGWLRDPRQLAEGIDLVTPTGERRRIDCALHRFPREDIEKQYQANAQGNGDRRLGFVTCLAGNQRDIAVLQPRFELRLRSGAAIELVPPAQSLDWSEARNAVLGAVPQGHLSTAALETAIMPAAKALHAAYCAERREPELADYGSAPARPAVSVIVPLYRNLEFMRFQVAAFATDREFADVELIYVLDSPEQRAELEHLLLGLHMLHDLPMRLVVMSGNFGFASACNAGAAAAKGERLLFCNSDVIPDHPGWIGSLLRAAQNGTNVGAVGAKLMFEDDSLQHAGMYFTRDPRGSWLNNHYFKGMPRDFALATVERSVPAVTGALIMLPRALFMDVGGFTDDYIIGDYEDSDLCLKVRQRGHDVRYVPAAELYHLERRSIQRHAGYMRGVAWEYNRRLHAERWSSFIEQVMAADAGEASASAAKLESVG